MTKRFAAIGGHHAAKAATVEWLTPPAIIAALGPFDLDPCAAIAQPWPTAARAFTRRDNGLLRPWDGRVWLNPPYTSADVGKWLGRLAEHGRGTALIFARTETDTFFREVWDRATALLFMRGRINFHFGEPWTCGRTGKKFAVGDRAPANSGAPTVLCAYGVDDADVLAFAGIEGHFVPLRFPRSVLVERPPGTWLEEVDRFLAGREGPVSIEELWRAFRGHRKAAGNGNVRAKLRQVMARGPYRRVSAGLFDRA